MALNFPSSPALNDIYTSSGKSWKWNGTAWTSMSDAPVTATSTDTFSNKSISLASNTLTGTITEFNTALTDADFATTSTAQTLTTKTISLGSNTISGTLAQFNTALSDADFASTATTQTLTNKTIDGGIYSGLISKTGYEKSSVVSLGAGSSINCTNGNYFSASISANTTYTFTNAPSGGSYSFILELVHTSGTVTWPTSVKWPNNTPPTLTSGKIHIFVFVTDDAGTSWYGSSLVGYNT